MTLQRSDGAFGLCEDGLFLVVNFLLALPEKCILLCVVFFFTVRNQLNRVVARLFNTVGPRQTGHYGMVVPSFVRQLRKLTNAE